MSRKLGQRIFSILTLAGLLIGLSAPAGGVALARSTDQVATVSDSPAGQKPGLELKPAHAAPAGVVLGETKGSAEPEYYIVQLVDAPLASYRGGVAGLAATNPGVTGERKLSPSSPASVAYANYLAGKQDQMIASIEGTVGHAVEVLHRYHAAFNGLAVWLTPQEAAAVAQLDGVRQVERNQMRQLLTDAGPTWIGAPGIWDGSTTGGLPGTYGEGVIAGIIDTGINSDHPSFADIGGDGYDHTNPFGAGNYVGWCNPGYPILMTCNDKLIGMWSYPESGNDPEDDDSHGSHTSSTVAGNFQLATLNAPTTSITELISGVAPHANIIMYDACAGGGCPETALVASVDQAVLDGVDVINYSISGGDNPYSDSVSQAFLAAVGANVFVSASAGNSGPGPATVAHNEPWVQTVGASTHNRTFANSLINMIGGATPPPADITGRSITSAYGPALIVYAGDYGDPLCPLGAFPPGTWSGEIVVCDRGLYARVDKGQAVLDGGAGGYVLANAESNGNSLNADGHYLPAVHITYDDGVTLKAWLADGGAFHVASIAGTSLDLNPASGDIMADFSSRGPGSLDVIKPDVTAPGVDIWAAYANGAAPPPPPEYGMMSGTSMSSPHSAGAAALMRALHPTWSPAEIKSAIMSTGLTATVLKEDGATPADLFDMGAGRIDLSGAGEAGLVLDETEANFAAADPNAGGDPRTLNLASMANSACPAICSWNRTVKSVATASVTWTASTSAPAGMTLTVDPAIFTIAPGATQAITVTADVTGLPADAWAFGQVDLAPSGATPPAAAHFPVAVVPVTGVLPDLIEIHTRRNAGSELVPDLMSVYDITDLTIDVYGLTQATLTEELLDEDPTNGDPYDNPGGTGTFYVLENVPAGAPRFISEIIASEAPDIDLFVGLDTGDGKPQASEEVCSSTTPQWAEICDLADPPPGTYWVLVQSWAGSGSQPDAVTLATGVVPGSDSGNMAVLGPASVPAGTPFDLNVFWDTPGMVAGDRWYGAFDIGSSPGILASGDIGRVPVNIIRQEDDVTKTVDSPNAVPGDTLTYTITVQPNVTPVDLTYTLTDTIPAGLTYVPGSATGGAVVVGDTLTWSGTMPAGNRRYVMTTSDTDAACAMPLATDGAYTDLALYGIYANPAIVGDTVWYALAAGDNIEYYGADVGNIINFTDDGFAFFDPSTPGSTPWANTDIPDPGDPNNLLAMFWQDLEIVYDGGLNRGVTLAALTSGPDEVATIIEYDDVEVWGDPGQTYDFEVNVYYKVDDAAGAYEITYAYDNIAGNLNIGTVGVENADGTDGTKFAYDDAALGTIHNQMAICFDWAVPTSDPHEITYQVTVDAGASGTYTNQVVHDTDNPGSQPATTSVDVLVGAGGPVDDTAYANTYDGWYGADDPLASGGGYRAADTLGETISYRTAQATAVALVTYRGPDQGKAQVLIDGVDQGTLDLYAPAPEYQYLQAYTGLPNTPHVIVVRALEQKNPASTGYEVRVDGFFAGGALVEDNDPSVRYNGWIGLAFAPAFGGSLRAAVSADTWVSFDINGSGFTWITARGPKCGVAKVYVDGVPVGPVNLYNPTWQFQYGEVITGLPAGPHTVQIEVLGAHGGGSTGNIVVFDGFSVP